MNSATTLRAIALEHPATIRVFEQFHLDYCCGGKRPLGEVCAEKCIAAELVLAALDEAVKGEPSAEDFSRATPKELIRHIVDTHHAYVRSELPRLQAMAERVASKHGANHPEVLLIQRNLAQLAEELIFHLNKEERILFPYIVGLERSRAENTAPPSACFNSVESPIQAMIHEHEGAAGLLEEMRTATQEFTPWPGACPTSGGLFYGVKVFEADLHRHVHLENNLLFPRAIALEQELLAAR